MIDILSKFDPITLEQMSSVKLMNRTDTKFVTNLDKLRQLLEMAQVFRISWWRRLGYIYLPHLKPFLFSACSVALGMSWKSGVAAEVIGVI